MNIRNQAISAFQDEKLSLIAPETRVSSLSAWKMRVRVPSLQSRWMLELQDRFDDLTSLPRGWDGYSGSPVSFGCARFAASLIERLYVEGVPTPHLVPGGDGSVQIEWHQNFFDIEIDVLAPYDVVAMRRSLRTGEVEEIQLQSDFGPLAIWISDLQENDGKAQGRRI